MSDIQRALYACVRPGGGQPNIMVERKHGPRFVLPLASTIK